VPAAAAQHRDPLGVAVLIVGDLDPRAEIVLTQQDFGEVGDRIGLVLRECGLAGRELAVIGQHPQPAGLPLPHGDRGDRRAQIALGFAGCDADDVLDGVRRGHRLRETGQGAQPRGGMGLRARPRPGDVVRSGDLTHLLA
jgi:hypothetical protein